MMSHGAVSVITNILAHLNSPLLMSVNPPLTGDDLVRTQLQNLRKTEFHWLIYATLAVIVGVIFEEIDVILQILNIKTERLVVSRIGAIVVPRFELSTWVRRISRVAWIVLVAGLVAEIFFESDISELDTEVETVSESQIQAARGEAADADERAAKNEKEAGQLRKAAEAERIKRITLEASVGWRHLTEQQQNVGFNIALRFRNAAVSIWYLHGDIEGARFAADIAEALRKAKLNVWPPAEEGLRLRGAGNINDPITRDPTGLRVEPTTTNGISGFLADAIMEELSSRGFDATREKATRGPDFTSPPHVVISVLARPEGPQGEFKLEAEREAKRSTAKKK
jgi:hypothetical protein